MSALIAGGCNKRGVVVTVGDTFNEQFYLAAHADVRLAVATGVFSCGKEHYERFGKLEGRRGALPNFETITYNPNTPFGVTAKLHPEDFILLFALGTNKEVEPTLDYYYSIGRDSALKVREVLSRDTDIDPDSTFSLLEFASGYGCITRHLSTVLPAAKITSCDIHPQAMRFLSEEMRVETALSNSQPENLDLGHSFDVIFALSFFTHMPERTYGRWLAALFRHVAPGGYLVFTTAGDKAIEQTPNSSVSEDGFGFMPQSEQGDLDVADYGSTFSRPYYVTRRIHSLSKASLVALRTSYWWSVQDTYVVMRHSADG